MKITNQYKSVLTLLLGISPFILSAQSGDNPIFDWIFNNMLFVVAGIIILGTLLSLWKLMFAFIDIERDNYLSMEDDVENING